MTELNPAPTKEQVPAESKAQMDRRTEDIVTPVIFWGTIIQASILLLVSAAVAYLMSSGATAELGSEQAGMIITYFGPALVAILGITNFSSIVFTIRRRQDIGYGLTFFSLVVFVLSATLVVQGRAINQSLLLVIIASLGIRWICPPRSRRFYIVSTVIALTLTWVIEWINPPWRIGYSGTVQVGSTAAIIFFIVIAVVVARQAWRGNILAKLLTAFIGVTLVATGVLGAFMYITTSNNLRANLERELTAQATDRATRIGNLLNEQITALTTLSLNEALQDAVKTQNGSYVGSATAIQATLDTLDAQWRAADAADNNNDFLVQWNLTNTVARELIEYQQIFPDNVEVFATDVYGGLVGTTNRTSDYYQADEGWWQAAYNNGEGAVYISEPEFDESAGAVAVLIALPLRNQDTGEITGILRTTYIVSPLESILTEKFGQTAEADLYIPGEVITHFQEGEFVPAEPEEFKALQAAAGQGLVEMDYEGTSSVVVQAPVQTLVGNSFVDKLGWMVVFHQQRDDAFAPMSSQVLGIVIVLAVVVALAAAAAYFLSLVLVRPILRLTATAEEVSAGDLSSRAEVTTADEVGTLATAFNTMTSRLQETLQGLEQRVAERTQNLELAADVGRSVSQVRDLDVMLQDACELIRDEFDLYYVQVYLTDPSQMTLQLQAGTGEVGAQLLERGHRLQLNTGSINGRAAVEKHTMVISNTLESTIFRPNSLLPDTRGEMAVPLIVNDKVVGVLDMQSSRPGVLDEEVIPAFEALAGQLAVAVQNATLLEEAKQARAEVEAQARRQIRANWAEYLDAVHKPEQIGFVFDRNEVAPLEEADQLPDESRSVSAPISLTGEEFGSLVVELDDESKNDQTTELVNTVARQVAQQLENLRLLDSAERYRLEAEQAARRQTRQGWQEYINTKTEANLSFLYDLNEVRPYRNGHETDKSVLTLPLKVRDETLGMLSVDGLTPDDKDSLELVDAVAERLGAHIESLRLSEQIQKRAQREQTLRQITSALRGSTNPETIMRIAVRELGSILGRKTIVQVLPSEQGGKQAESAGNNGNGSNPTADLSEPA
jgi:GAF domain-containing protein/HAMP domain-containing protein